MKIIYLKLVKFKRFPLRDIEVFEEDFNSNKLFGIVGANGSGKSSLLKELSPLPALKDNFYAHGYKEIHIELNHQIYKLISDFTSSPKYSFIVEDEELNTAKLITTQKELVKKHFNLTEDIFDILTGVTTFTSLTIQQRKKLFNSITHINIDEFIDLYEVYKEEEKIQTNMLKSYTTSLNIEAEKLLNPDKIEELKTRHKVLTSFVNDIADLRSNLTPYRVNWDKDKTYSDFSQIKQRTAQHIKKYYFLLTSYPYKDLNRIYKELAIKKSSIDASLSIRYTQLEQYTRSLKELELAKENSLQDVDGKLIQLQSQLNHIASSLTIFDDVNLPIHQYQTELYKVESLILEFIYEVELNQERQYTKERYETSLKNKEESQKQLNKLLEEEARHKNDIIHLMDNHSTVDMTCPKCNYVFTPNVSEKMIESLNEKVTEVKKKHAELAEHIKEIDSDIKDQEKYFNLLQHFTKIISQTPNLKPLWNQIKVENLYFVEPTQIPTRIKQSLHDLSYIEQYQKLLTQFNELKSIKETLSQNDNEDQEVIHSRIDLIEEEIESFRFQGEEIEQQFKYHEMATKVYEHLSKMEMIADTKFEEVQQTNLSTIIESIVNGLEVELSKVKLQLIEVETLLNNYKTLSTVISSYKEKIEQTKDRLFVLDKLIEELSPKSGIIAKIISNFLNNIIRYMNTIISNVMDYRVIIELLNIEESVLDYRFKFTVEDKLPVNDISIASSGMREIIDLSFKLVFYKLLKLYNYPLYLDEFGVRLDTSHRSKVQGLIFKFINDTNYSQIFLVTHLDTGILNYKDSRVLTLS